MDIPSPFGPDFGQENMDEMRRFEKEKSEYNFRILKDNFIKAMKESRVKTPDAKLQIEIAAMKVTLEEVNKLFDSSMRFNLQFMNAMLFCLSAIPMRVGIDLLQRESWKKFATILYAMRMYLVEERDKTIAQSNPQVGDKPIPPTGV